LSAFIAAEVRKQTHPISLSDLAEITNQPEQEINQLIQHSLPKDIEIKGSGRNLILIHAPKIKKLREQIDLILSKHHNKNPLITKGKTFDELAGMLGLNQTHDAAFLTIILEEMLKEGILKKVEGTFALSEKSVIITEEDQKKIEMIDQFILNSGMKVPLMNEIKEFAQVQGIPQKELHDIINFLIENKDIVTIEGSFIHAEIIEKAQNVLIAHFKKHDTLILADFRDNLQANRKICLLLLSYFDDRGWTVRKGDYRILSEKGKELISE